MKVWCQGQLYYVLSVIYVTATIREENLYMKLQRNIELQGRKELYEWADKSLHESLKDYPGFHTAAADSNALPKDVQVGENFSVKRHRDMALQFDDETRQDFLFATLRSVFSVGKSNCEIPIAILLIILGS